MAMVQAEAAQPTELQPSVDAGHSLLPEAGDIPSLFARMADSIKTGWDDLTSSKRPDDVQTLASNLVNGKGSFESVMQNIDSLKSQGRLTELSDLFDRTYSTSLRDQLTKNYPGRDAEIDKVLGTNSSNASDPMLGGLSREQLKTILDKFPELKDVIKDPEVLGAMVQNEKDNTYNWKDVTSELPLKALAMFDRQFKKGDGTDWLSTFKLDELKAKVDNSNGKPWYQRIGDNLKFKSAELLLNMSIGDAQMQIRNIISLRDQEKAAGREVPTVSSSFTPEGSAQLVGAYFAKSVQMLTDHTIEDPKQNPFMRDSNAVRNGFKEAQRLWDTGDPELRLRAVMMTYNPGISNSDPTKWNPEHILKHYLGRK